MIGHCIIWTGIICLALIALGLFASWKIPFLFVGHYLMDNLKCRKIIDENQTKPLLEHNLITIHDIQKIQIKNKQWVYGDQLFHMGQLLCVSIF